MVSDEIRQVEEKKEDFVLLVFFVEYNVFEFFLFHK